MTRRKNHSLPILALRDVVVYPGMIIPLFVGREKSVAALEYALNNDSLVFSVAQKDPSNDAPLEDDLYQIGTVAKVLQLLKLPDGSVKSLVEGVSRAQIINVKSEQDYLTATVKKMDEQEVNEAEAEVLRRTLLDEFEEYSKVNKKIPSEIINSIQEINDLGRLVDTLASQVHLKITQKQELLELIDISGRISTLLGFIETEIDILQVEKKIRGRVKRQMDKSQREYYLNEQVKAIQKELGEEDEKNELDQLEKKIKSVGMSDEASKKAMDELKKLKMMPSMSAESTVVRNYIDVLVDLPWNKKSKVSDNLQHAQEILDSDHYGLEKVKERILEYLAVQKRVGKIKGPILCLVGPPGVGKTSLGRSIAAAIGRNYVRVALGGLHDESEIRGHRRTYIGSMPGKILQNISKSAVNNPLFLLDEVDKIGQDFKGDPSSALLEVLDPEQNQAFVDNYVEVEFDLSDVMFIATSNTLNIPPALLDRMEVIYLSGYTEDEKVNIAKNYLIPKQIKINGLKENELVISEAAIRDIIRYYTREAGVRSLERTIAKVCRKVVMSHSLSQGKKPARGRPKVIREKLDSGNLSEFLGVQRYDFGKAESENRIGQVTGLAWTEVGGELLTVEAVALKGKGNVIRTGTLGDVMKESISAAVSVVRSRSSYLGIPVDFYEKYDLHIHVPEGATPKDGPSAGGAMTLAIVSAITGIPVRADVAMTGEITLRGEILPIGGLKEKLLAALRGGIKYVLIPKGNMKDLEEIPDNVKQGLSIQAVQWIDEILDFSLEYSPKPLLNENEASFLPLSSEVNKKNKRAVKN